ncbi:uncharacterized protein LOC134767242 [Penaeus indicus]|uniref:uncharacterized protein LOC134767242 n=1 Tax=Penaeus indicus TaxID=29960 RepID=UPI00300CCF72
MTEMSEFYGNYGSSIFFALACALERSLQYRIPRHHNTGRWQLPAKSPELIGFVYSSGCLECRPKAENRTAIRAPGKNERNKPPGLELATWNESDYTFFWQGQELHERRLYGVDFAVRNSLLSTIESPSSGTPQVLSLRLTTSSGLANILSVYAPTLCSTVEAKDQFYKELEAKIRQISAKEHLFLHGDFNARVGADLDSWPRCIGHFGIGNINENGQRLLELCSFHDLCLTNTFFATKLHRRVSWRHPRSRHWHQLDFVITRRTLLNHVLVTHSYHSADCDTDHSLVVSKVHLLPRWVHHSKQKPQPHISKVRINNPELREHFARAIDTALEDCPAAPLSMLSEPPYLPTKMTPPRRRSRHFVLLAATHRGSPDTVLTTIGRASAKTSSSLQTWATCGVLRKFEESFWPKHHQNWPHQICRRRSDCDNSRSISLLSIVGKAFARVDLGRLQLLAEHVYPEAQCGFRTARSTIGMVFSVRQLQEKCREQRQPLYLAFIDLTKAFDLDMSGTVQFDGSCSEPFPIRYGVKKGCVLAPTLFGIFFSLLLSHAFGDSDDGIFIHTRSDGGLFNLARLQAKTKVRKVLIRELLFADDAALAAHTEAGLQRLIDRFAAACAEFGLNISLKKMMSTTPPVSPSPTTPSRAEHRLTKRVWDNTMLTINTKMRVYQACVLSTLLYGSEAWTLYSDQE